MDRLVEIMQIKGNSECQTGIGTTDEECNFETVFQACKPGQQGGCNNEDAFVRNGLKKGLQVEADRGVNPFKHGIIGSTDTHNGTPGDTAEDDFAGHAAKNDGTPSFGWIKAQPPRRSPGLDEDPTKLYNPGAIAGVWAEANTREAIWDALQRKETFGTSGTRAAIRLMGGFDLPDDLGSRADWVKVGYERGVPQGGTSETHRAVGYRLRRLGNARPQQWSAGAVTDRQGMDGTRDDPGSDLRRRVFGRHYT